MKKILTIAAVAAVSPALPQLALAQDTSQHPSSTSIRAQLKSDLEQAGFTNVHIMQESFLVRATDRSGNPVMMVINPDSITEISATNPDGGNASSQNQDGQTPSKSAKMTNDQRNSGSQERVEADQTNSKSSKMDSTGPNQNVEGPNGMIAELKEDESQGLNLSAAQRSEIWRKLDDQPQENVPAGFEARLGELVPNTVRLRSLPNSVSSQVPVVKSYQYAMIHGRLLLVDPTTKKIVAIIFQ
jgi:Protein of unknown function (DUF1236)